MSSSFNNNKNIDLFERLQSIVEDKDLLKINAEKAQRNRSTSSDKALDRKTFDSLLERKYDEFLVGEVKPLTKEEAKVIDDRIMKYEVEKGNAFDRLEIAENAIEETMEKRNLSFTLPIVKNKKLKRAAKRFFKERKKEITFQDYKKALSRMKELQKMESKDIRKKKED